ncbi:hypothetical protein [Streptomyces oceani]|uniref:hypothetical protein n=1 Tax=Streptomyces oceani TaxID=1075402 RepID=UPI0008732BDD|nr:hypothetical protein [Streptomyces oceani]
MTTVRWTLGAAGAVLLIVGCWLLLDTRSGTVGQVLLWLAGAVAVHDGLLVPSVLLVGLGLRMPRRRLPGYAFGVLRGGLVVAGSLTLLALPLVIREGQGRNPSVLPLDYADNWAALVAGTAVVTLVLLLGGGVRARVRGRTSGRAPRATGAEGPGRRSGDRAAPPVGRRSAARRTRSARPRR